MHHLTLCFLLIIGVDAIVPHIHYTHYLARRFHGNPQTLDVSPRSSRAMNSVDPLVQPDFGSSSHVHTRQLRREVADHDWAHAAGVETSPNGRERGANYLSKTRPAPPGQPAQSVPIAKSTVDAAPTSTSSPVDHLSATSPRQAQKKGHAGKGPQHYHKGDTKHHLEHSKKAVKKTMKL